MIHLRLKIFSSFCSYFAILLLTLFANVSVALDISTVVSSSYAQPGEPIHVEIIVSNDSLTQENNLAIEMVYPAGIAGTGESFITGPFDTANSCASNGGATTCTVSELMIWDVGTLNPGQAVKMSFPTSVSGSAADGDIIQFQADLLQNNNSAGSDIASVEVDVNTELKLSVDQNKDPASSGDVLVYALRYGNTSASSITNSVLTFPIPVGTTFVSAPVGAVFSNGVVTWDLGTLPSGQVGRRLVVTTVSGSATNGDLLEASASISGTSQATFQATQQQAVSMAYVADEQPLSLALNIAERIKPSEPIQVEMVVSNTTDQQVTNAVVQMRYPLDGLSGTAEAYITGPFNALGSCLASSGSTVCTDRELMNWSVGTLNPGQAVTLTFPATLSTGTNGLAVGSLIDFEAKLTADSGLLINKAHVISIESSADLRLSVDENKDPVSAGDTLVYTLRYGNTSASSVTNGVLIFPVPVGTTFVSATGGGTLTDGNVVWGLGSLASGQVGQLQVETIVSNSAENGDLLQATSLITGTSQATFQPTIQQVSSTAYVAGEQPLSLALNIAERIKPSEPIQVEMVVSNTTDQQVTNAVVQMRYPLDGLSGTAEAYITGPFNALGSCLASSGSTVCTDRELMNWSVGTLNPGQAVTLTFPATVSTGTNGLAVGSLMDFEAKLTTDTGLLINESQSVAIDSNADLRLSVDEDKDPVSAGDTLVYTLRYGNTSASSVTGSNVSFPVPEGVTFVSATGGGTLTNGVVSWSLGTLSSGQVGQLQVVTTVSNSAENGDLLEAFASIDGTSQATFSSTLQQAASTAYVAGEQPLSLALNILERIKPSESMLVEMVVSNTTDQQVTNAVVQMRYPLDGLSGTAEAYITGPFNALGSCLESSGSTVCTDWELMNWSVGTLNPGQAVTLTFPASLSIGTQGLAVGSLMDFEAKLTTDTGLLINESQSVAIDSNADLRLSVDEDKGPVSAGDTLVYTLRYGNTSASSVTGSNVSFPVPEGVTFVSATGGGTLTNGVVSWDLGTLLSGQVGQLQVVTTVSNSAENGDLLEAFASIDGTSQATFSPTLQQAASTAYVAASTPLSLAFQVLAQPAEANELTSVSIEVLNESSSQIFGASLQMRYPIIGLNGLLESSIIGPFDAANSCAQGGGSTVCSSGELLNWNLGTLNPGQVVQVSFDPTTLTNIDNGNLVDFLVELTEDTGSLNRASINVPIGNRIDTNNNSIGLGFELDDDSDGIDDEYELNNGLNPQDVADAALNPDMDGLTNLQEFLQGTDINLADTDDDGLIDGSDPFPTNNLVGRSAYDFNGDGDVDVILSNDFNNNVRLFDIENGAVTANSQILSNSGSFTLFPPADFDGDGDADLLLRDRSTQAWTRCEVENSALVVCEEVQLFTNPDWLFVDAKDFDGDNDADVLLRNRQTGGWRLFRFEAGDVVQDDPILLPTNTDFEFVAGGDFDKDVDADVLLRNTVNGVWRLLTLSNGGVLGDTTLSLTSSLTTQLQGVADFDADGDADLLLRNQSTGVWTKVTMEGADIAGVDGLSLFNGLSWSFRLAGDFDRDGDADVLLQNTSSSQWRVFTLSDGVVSGNEQVALFANSDYELAWLKQPAPVKNDFFGDFDSDVLIRNTSGAWRLFPIENLSVGVPNGSGIGLFQGLDFVHQVNADFDGDGDSDVLMRRTTDNSWRVFEVQNGSVQSTGFMNMFLNSVWEFQAAYDFDADGDADILQRRSDTGQWRVFEIEDLQVVASNELFLFQNQQWELQEVADYDGDGDGDILIRRTTTGQWRLFSIEDLGLVGNSNMPLFSGTSWNYITSGDMDKDGVADIVLRNTNGSWRVFDIANATISGSSVLNLFSNNLWQHVQTGDFDRDGDEDMLLRRTDNGLWRMFEIENRAPVSNSQLGIWSNLNFDVKH